MLKRGTQLVKREFAWRPTQRQKPNSFNLFLIVLRTHVVLEHHFEDLFVHEALLALAARGVEVECRFGDAFAGLTIIPKDLKIKKRIKPDPEQHPFFSIRG